jgi:hypothetical protein
LRSPLDFEAPPAGRRRAVCPTSSQGDRALFAPHVDRRDPAAREALVEHFLPLARQLARTLCARRQPLEELSRSRASAC